MKLPLVCLSVLFCFASVSVAQRLDWKPEDFESLVGLPWEEPGIKMPEVLKRLYLEPDVEIRYPLLMAYLKQLPVGDLDSAFRLTLVYEGTQHPQRAVSRFLAIWAERDIEAAFAKAMALLQLVVVTGEPLELDAWEMELKVADLATLQKSAYWLSPEDLEPMASYLESSELPHLRRTELLKQFAVAFISATGRMPRVISETPALIQQEMDVVEELLRAWHKSEAWILQEVKSRRVSDVVARASLNRLLSQNPSNALQIMESANPTSKDLQKAHEAGFPPLSFLSSWSRLDRPAMQAWTEKQDIRTSQRGLDARAVLMGRADDATRARWLREVAEQGMLPEFYGRWVQWSPELAIPSAVQENSPAVLDEVLRGVISPPLGATNRSHWAIGVFRDFDLQQWYKLHAKREKSLPHGWGTIDKEAWAYIDVGEAARHAFRLITSEPLASQFPREQSIKLFSGDHTVGTDDGPLDRAFCCLRFWAMWKPDEMRKWIAGVGDTEMQKALTWTLENPWGREAPAEKADGR